MADFLSALPFTLQNEGGYVDDPNDAGGATNFGITEATARAWGFDGDMQDLTQDDAAAIYQADYWDNWSLDDLTSQAVATAVFDLHVNMGGGAAQVIQAAVADCGVPIVQDGAWGPATRAAVNRCNPAQLVPAIAQEAAARYQTIAANNPNDAGFLDGWLNRAAALGDLLNRYPVAAGGTAVLLLGALGLYLFMGRKA